MAALAARDAPISAGFGSVTITPSDTATIQQCRALYVGGGGSVKVAMLDGSTPTFNGMIAGVVYSIQFNQVFATGTTATNLVGII